jgi:thioredoxin reductase
VALVNLRIIAYALNEPCLRFSASGSQEESWTDRRRGYICTGRDLTTWKLDRHPFPLETSLPGVFSAGDVRHNSIKRVSSGVGEGSMAIAFIHQYLAL